MKINRKEKVVMVVFFIIFMLYAISLIIPFIWLGLNSLKSNSQFYKNVWNFPEKLMFSNYADAVTYTYKSTNMLKMIFNSLILIIVCVSLNIYNSVCTAYAIAKFKFKFRKLLFNVVVIFMVVPSIGATAATYKFLVDIKLFDTFWCIFLISSGGFGTVFLIIYSSFVNVSSVYSEAAKIDGANEYVIFFRIMIPQALPVIKTMAIISAIGVWNDYYTPYMYLPSTPTLAVGINEMQVKFLYDSKMTSFFAAMLLSILPVIILFSFCQKQIMQEGISAGGLKG